jgi:glycosyltransferase involved in cell wall biosynthesis
MTRPEKPTPPPKVSIGMPVYNGEKYIREALDSLLAQTFTDFDLIISDNASTDDTEAICREYAARDPRIRYVRQSENRGIMANFQFVLDEARGEHFMWAAADDRWDPDWLAALLSQLNADVSVAFGSVVPFVDSGRLGSRFVLKSLVGPTTIRMVRYYMWRESGPKPCAIYGLYRTAELREVANDVIAGVTGESWGADNILVFAMLGVGCLRVDAAVVLYKRVRIWGGVGVRRSFSLASILVRAVELFLASSRSQWLPYLIDHVRHSPPGCTRWAVVVVGPLKYVCLALDWLSSCVATRWGRKVARLPDAVRLTWRWFSGSQTNNWAAEVGRLTRAPATDPIMGRPRQSSR